MTLKELGVVDNPFDVILHTTLELARETAVLCTRFDNPDMPIVSMDNAYHQWQIDRLDEMVTLLKQLSPEDLELCRKTAFCSTGKNAGRVNAMLLGLSREIPTVYAQSSPRYPLEFEKARFGEDSDEYKRRRVLDELLSSDFVDIETDMFHSVADYLENGMEYCKECFGWSAEFSEQVGKLQYDYDLTESDIDYIITNK